MMMTKSETIYLETMGCQMNALDSDLTLGALMARGFRLTDEPLDADLVVLNTCSVRQHAEDKVYSRLGHLKGSRKRNPEQIVAVIGCMAERDGDGLLEKMSHVDILCGPSELHRLPSLIDDVRTTRRPAIALSGRLREHSTEVRHVGEHEDLEALDSGRTFGLTTHAAMPKVFGRHQAYVRITRGCNKFCTFCVVPYTRGPERHRPPGQIVEEVRRLAENGVMEVTLLGQTVNHYHYVGEGPDGETSFAELLRRVHDEVPALPRLRFVTSFPRDFTDEALEVMASSPRICKYLHIPAQSGSNLVLKRMNRGYTIEQYLALLDRARSLMPELCIAGDMIVGFSGETEDEFRMSLELLRSAKYKNCFIFKYSPRPGTLADDRLPDDVPDEEKRLRNNEMLAVQAEINLANHQAMLGRTVEVLVEGPSKGAIKAQESEQSRGEEVDQTVGLRNQLVGRTTGDQMVVFDGVSEMIGRFLQTQIIAATPYTLHGRVVGEAGGGATARSGELPLAVLNA
ncbi:MAG: tRNA (N6-isopentenyl adenosine(37)-C2)-methylthiotransferase MiaB [Phycisphaerales bacterium]|nr:tRNA (N6-isopentenyl adenosine(37)-C2)-methylthiotransferase MiaB [Phycisphaerales bacterium]